MGKFLEAEEVGEREEVDVVGLVKERLTKPHAPGTGIKGKEGREKNAGGEERSEEEEWRYRWKEEDIELYKERTEGEEDEEEISEVSVEEKWGAVKELVKDAMIRVRIKRRKKKLGYKEWWDRSCTRKKRIVHRLYKGWRIGKSSRERFLEERRSFKEHVEEKKRKKLLGGEEVEEERESERGKIKEEKQVERELKTEEIAEAVKKLKKGKAAGIDGIPMEAWKYGGGKVKRRLADLLTCIWKGGGIPEDWRKSVIATIYKKGDTEKMENYRGISLLCTAYKICAEVLRKRLKDEVEHGTLVPESQGGFRKDLSSAFDNVNRKELWEILERKNINGTLIQRMKEIYEDTRAAIRTKEWSNRKNSRRRRE
ncbi:cilia- and flagella-associated protein 251-like [Pogonomyrmex barbatus]|uniref:Cilia- and flagella-associated protein 251-like n=1 Tax=Pogonomyrmex barbatus TaxID=144034 RepID=A0A6I9WGG8_9HYME|nr:cilia- and flagella-associated protein 251-like [Pogonomyrmex barbatus]